MKSAKSILAPLLAIGLVVACSDAPEHLAKKETAATIPTETVAPKTADEAVPDTNLDSPEEEKVFTLGLKSMDADSQTKQKFIFPKETMIHINKDMLISFATADGQYVNYNAKLGTWGSVQVAADKVDYDTLYHFTDDGFMGAKDKILTLRIGSGKIERLNFSLPKSQVLGLGIGYFASMGDGQIDLLQHSDNGYSLLKIKDYPENIKFLKPCAESCIAWAFDGTQLYILQTDKIWKKKSLSIVLPAGQSIANLTMDLKYNGELDIGSAVILTDSGSLFIKDEASSGVKQTSWKDVSKLVEHFCVSCHMDDGYDKEATWSGLKSAMILRLKPDAASPMPPVDTKLAKEMSAGDKALILKWLDGVKQTEPPAAVPKPNTPAPTDNTLISGVLKTQADSNCIQCHTDANKVSWWQTRKANASSRINAGTMPPNSTLSAEARKTFVDAINALN